VESWDLRTLEIEPHHPRILHSSLGEARSIAIRLPAGESLGDHQVHEYAHLIVISGDVDVRHGDEETRAATGFMAIFDPGERHAVHALTDARLLLILAPWPGDGHPGARF
jgi:quercetin dioxygenase-like cupin family protein